MEESIALYYGLSDLSLYEKIEFLCALLKP